MKINIACCITLLRIVLTPVVVWLMLQNSWSLALLVFLLAVLTDLVDGFVARALQQSSKFGQLLDPVADKILLGSVMYTMLLMMQASMMQASTMQGQSIYAFALYFLLGKELVLLLGGGLLWFWLKIFIPPSLLSRGVSLCEVLFVFAMFLSKAGLLQVSDVSLLGILIVNIALSIWLLVRYALLVKKFLK